MSSSFLGFTVFVWSCFPVFHPEMMECCGDGFIFNFMGFPGFLGHPDMGGPSTPCLTQTVISVGGISDVTQSDASYMTTNGITGTGSEDSGKRSRPVVCRTPRVVDFCSGAPNEANLAQRVAEEAAHKSCASATPHYLSSIT